MLWFSEEDVRELLPMGDAIIAVEEAFRLVASGRAQNLPRQRVKMSRRMFHNMLSGSEPLGYAGLKTYSVGRDGTAFHYFLYDAVSGELVAMMEADALGQIRTGAASGVATKLFADPSARSVGIIGTGFQARTQLEAVCEVASIQSAVAYGRDGERRERFCAEMSERLGLDVAPVQSARDVAGMDILITATTSRNAVLEGAWLRGGQHINAVGSNFAHRRELDDGAIQKASLLVVDDLEQARLECGDLLPSIESGRRSWDEVTSLSDYFGGDDSNRVDWKRRPEDITVFLSQGVAIEDLAVAKRVYESGLSRDVGRKLL